MVAEHTNINETGNLIFVSYAHENKGWIEALGLHKDSYSLESEKFWIDRNRIHPGDAWNKKAEHALYRATAIVCLISRQFLDSNAIRKHELPIVARRYHEEAVPVIFVPIGQLDSAEVEDAFGIDNIHDLLSIPDWKEPLSEIPIRREDIRDKIVSAATEPPEVQNLRRNIQPKYHLIKNLGQNGPLSMVFTAYDRQLQRYVVIKLLRKGKHDRHFKESVRNVANASDHTNILTIYGAYLDSVPPYYVRQYVSGDSLRTILDENQHGKPLPIPLIQELLPVLGAAINHAHRKNIYGINIKPSNVILTDPHSHVIREYYLSLNSYHEEDLLQDEEWRTTGKDVLFVPLEYRNKSVVRNAQDLKRADQYRLGLIAFEMLVGSARFEEIGKRLRQLDFNLTKWKWPAVATERENCAKYICHTVDQMIKTDPEERYESIDKAITDIRTDLDVEVVRSSYHRLLASKECQTDFFTSFYISFLDAYPKAEKFFNPKIFGELKREGKVNKGWQRQFQVLKEAVLLLAVFDAFHEDRHEINILTRIVEEHVKKGIPSVLYPVFGEVLIDTVIEKDRGAPLSKSKLRHAWSNVIQPGIAYMTRKTEEFEIDDYRNR